MECWRIKGLFQITYHSHQWLGLFGRLYNLFLSRITWVVQTKFWMFTNIERTFGLTVVNIFSYTILNYKRRTIFWSFFLLLKCLPDLSCWLVNKGVPSRCLSFKTPDPSITLFDTGGGVGADSLKMFRFNFQKLT